MPGTSPGRRQPVRGVASQINGADHVRRIENLNHPVTSASLPWETPIQRATSHLAATTTTTVAGRSYTDDRSQPQQPSSSWELVGTQQHHHSYNQAIDAQRQQQQQHQQHEMTRLRDTSGRRPFSSGFPAPATAVPIFRGPRSGPSLELPDSPPSTPPQSPPLTPRALGDLEVVPELSARDDDQEALGTPLAAMSFSRHQNLLAEATGAIFGSVSGPQQHSPPRLSGSDKAQPLAMRSAGAAGLMPATPEVSPDQEVQHFAVKSAKAFFHRIFKDFSEQARVEDAGVELVCPGWSGAVLKTSGSASSEAAVPHSESYSSDASNSSGTSSADSKRTLYVSMPSLVDQSQLREHVLALLDAASEKLGCDSVVLCLDRQMRDFAMVLHGLCYVGGQVVSVGRSSSSGGQEAEASTSSSWHSAPDVEAISGFAPRQGLVLIGIEL
ncbi:hypothetical protein ACQY0O_007797 [Thecaphora frezii]